MAAYFLEPHLRQDTLTGFTTTADVLTFSGAALNDAASVAATAAAWNLDTAGVNVIVADANFTNGTTTYADIRTSIKRTRHHCD